MRSETRRRCAYLLRGAGIAALLSAAAWLFGAGAAVAAAVFALAFIAALWADRLRARQRELMRAAETEALRANLLRAVSHDLRTPLQAISGAASLLSRDLEGMEIGRQRALLEGICEDAAWLVRMVENLLTVTRAGPGGGLLKETESLEEVAAEAVRKYRARHSAPEARIELPDEPVFAPMDAMLIGQVLSNLLENAALHATGARIVRVRFWDDADHAAFEVSDDGQGMPPEALNALYVGEGPSPRGMGLGLSICRAIVDAHGGKLMVLNLPGGACFRFTLPKEGEQPCAMPQPY